MNKTNNAPALQERITQLESNIRHFEKIHAIFSEVWQLTSTDDVIDFFLTEILALTEADQGTIFLFAPEQQQSAKTLFRKGESRQQTLDSYLNNMLAGWVSGNRRILFTENLPETFGAENLPDKYRNVRSALSIPLLLGEKLIGVINLISYQKNSPFNVHTLPVMKALATHCARYIHNASLQEKMFTEAARLRYALQRKFDYQGVIGHSVKMRQIFSLMERVIPTDARVLIEGESGTGKERIARVLHFNGPRKDGPFVTVDCGALPATLLESELFGYVKGAFTGANRDRKGLFAEAHGGTLFLDEIGNMPMEMQAKLLRAIQEGEIRPIGANETYKISVRIIAATSLKLREAVEKGEFRQDLYFRLNVISLQLPLLRDRREDIALLAQHFLERSGERYNKPLKGFSPDCIRHLENHRWPGNIRELEHAVERAVVLSQGEYLTPADFDALTYGENAAENLLFQPRPLHTALNEFKALFLQRVLQHTSGKQTVAADILEIQRTYLNRLLKDLNVR